MASSVLKMYTNCLPIGLENQLYCSKLGRNTVTSYLLKKTPSRNRLLSYLTDDSIKFKSVRHGVCDNLWEVRSNITVTWSSHRRKHEDNGLTDAIISKLEG